VEAQRQLGEFNASEALAKKGNKLVIHIYDSPDWKAAGRKGVRIVIADDGSGIPREPPESLGLCERAIPPTPAGRSVRQELPL
jgi:hypothetical protein